MIIADLPLQAAFAFRIGRFDPSRRQPIRAVALALAVIVMLSGARASARDSAAHLTGPAAAAPPLQFDLRRAVLLELGADGHLDASGIEATAENGIVILTGAVPLTSWKERAARVAGVVQGVRAVVNRIEVRPVSRPDRSVAEEVRKALRATAALKSAPITVRVQEGVVELVGVISSWEQQQLAERVARFVPGVRFCLNQLTSTGSLRRTPAIVVGEIQTRLDWDPLVQHAPIRVSLRGGRAFLAGWTGSAVERRRAITLAWVKGVTAVDATGLLVSSTHRPAPNVRLRFPTDSEILTTIQDLARYWPSVTMSALSVSVASGVATVRGNVATLAEKRAVELMMRSAVGVMDIKSELRGPWWRPPPTPPPAPPRSRPKRPRRTRSR
jgi:osmotically-inducible protein OsmY